MCLLAPRQDGGVHACTTAGWCFACLYYCGLELCKLELLQDGGVHAYDTVGW